jgi:hypothetical protein
MMRTLAKVSKRRIFLLCPSRMRKNAFRSFKLFVHKVSWLTPHQWKKIKTSLIIGKTLASITVIAFCTDSVKRRSSPSFFFTVIRYYLSWTWNSRWLVRLFLKLPLEVPS